MSSHLTVLEGWKGTSQSILQLPWTEAYVFPLYLMKTWATQKCDLVCGKRDHRGSGSSMLLSSACAKPADAMHGHTGPTGIGVSTKQEKEWRVDCVYKRTVTSLLSIPTKRKTPWNSPIVISGFLGHPVTGPDICCPQVWRKSCKSSASPISKLPSSSVGRKVSGKKLVPGQKPVGHSAKNRL